MRLIPILALVLTAVPMIGHAEEYDLIKGLDKDGDGKLSWAEIAPLGWNREVFEYEDRNGDGYITEEDFCLKA